MPKGITKVFRATTKTGFVVPRIFMDDTPEDKQCVQSCHAAGSISIRWPNTTRR